MGKGMEHKKYLWGLASGGIYFVVLFLISLVAMGVKDFSIFHTIRTMLICALSGMVGGMLS